MLRPFVLAAVGLLLVAAPSQGQALYDASTGLYAGVEGRTGSGSASGLGAGLRFASHFDASLFLGSRSHRGGGEATATPRLSFAVPVSGGWGAHGYASYDFGIGRSARPVIAGRRGEAAVSGFYHVAGSEVDFYPSLGAVVSGHMVRHGGPGTVGVLLRLPVAFDVGSERLVVEPTYRTTRVGADLGLGAYLNF